MGLVLAWAIREVGSAPPSPPGPSSRASAGWAGGGRLAHSWQRWGGKAICVSSCSSWNRGLGPGEDTQSQLCRPSGLGAEHLADKVCVVISRAPGQPGAVSLRGRASRVLGLPVCEQDIRGCLLALA